METKVSIKLEPFVVPESANEYGLSLPTPAQPPRAPSISWNAPHIAARQFQLSEVPAEVLMKMCDDFSKEVFKRAGKHMPPTDPNGASR